MIIVDVFTEDHVGKERAVLKFPRLNPEVPHHNRLAVFATERHIEKLIPDYFYSLIEIRT